MALIQMPYNSCLASESWLSLSADERRTKVWQQRRACSLSHASCLGAKQALVYRLDPPKVPPCSQPQAAVAASEPWPSLEGREVQRHLPRRGAATALKSLAHRDIFSSTVVILLLLRGSNSSPLCAW